MPQAIATSKNCSAALPIASPPAATHPRTAGTTVLSSLAIGTVPAKTPPHARAICAPIKGRSAIHCGGAARSPTTIWSKAACNRGPLPTSASTTRTPGTISSAAIVTPSRTPTSLRRPPSHCAIFSSGLHSETTMNVDQMSAGRNGATMATHAAARRNTIPSPTRRSKFAYPGSGCWFIACVRLSEPSPTRRPLNCGRDVTSQRRDRFAHRRDVRLHPWRRHATSMREPLHDRHGTRVASRERPRRDQYDRAPPCHAEFDDIDRHLVVHGARGSQRLEINAVLGQEDAQIFGDDAGEIVGERLGPAIELRRVEPMARGERDDLRSIEMLR